MKEYKVTGWTNGDNECFIEAPEAPEDPKIFKSMYEAVVKDVREHNYHFTGSVHQYNYCTPIINNKYLFGLSQRTWGQLMHDAYPEEDYTSCLEGREYCKWAWCIEDEEQILPSTVTLSRTDWYRQVNHLPDLDLEEYFGDDFK